MASLWEIFDPSRLQYDSTLGQSAADSGSGPPNFIRGWVRTGSFASDSANTSGIDNCSAWTVSVFGPAGTVAALQQDWGLQNTEWPWSPKEVSCDTMEPVWCVED